MFGAFRIRANLGVEIEPLVLAMGQPAKVVRLRARV